ncbi:MAG: HEAT repeat domain-containing protein [Candidatus Binatia bacterium]
MARGRQLDEQLQQLARARRDPGSAESMALLRRVLAGKSSHAAAAAAQIVGEAELHVLAPELVAAFARFLQQPVKSDPGCAAKAAIADALYRLNAAEIDLYLQGIRHVQLEPVWGGRADTATGLRGTCGLALVRVHYPDYLDELADLLADAEAPARRLAAQALAYSENPAAVPLLRLKALSGDVDPSVLGECLLALLAIAPRGTLPFVARFLERPEAEIAEVAALALGGSRLRTALPILTEWWERSFDPALRRSALLAIAMLKHDDALAYLLTHVAESPPVHAREAIRALGIYRHDPRLRAQLEAALAPRAEPLLRAAFTEAFGDS